MSKMEKNCVCGQVSRCFPEFQDGNRRDDQLAEDRITLGKPGAGEVAWVARIEGLSQSSALDAIVGSATLQAKPRE